MFASRYRWPLAVAAAALAAGCGWMHPRAPALAARTASTPQRAEPTATAPAAPAATPVPATAIAPKEPSAAVAPIPAAYRAGPVSHLVVAGADKAIKWYERVLGARETYEARGPKGRIMHAILRVGGSAFTLSDAYPELGSKGPKAFGGSPASIRVEVADADALFKKAIAAGATAGQPMSYELSGDRVGRFVDPFGQSWQVATHVANVPPTALGELAGEAAGAEPQPAKLPAQPKPAKAAQPAAPAKPATPATPPPAKAATPPAKPATVATPPARPAKPATPPAHAAKPRNRPMLVPDLIVTNVDKAVAYYEAAFGATERNRLAGPDGRATHASIVIRRQLILLDLPAAGQKAPSALGGAAASLTLYVKDADAAFKKAIAAGATARLPVMDMFWGDRWGELVDPLGQVWSIATHKQDVPLPEIEKRAAAAFAKVK